MTHKEVRYYTKRMQLNVMRRVVSLAQQVWGALELKNPTVGMAYLVSHRSLAVLSGTSIVMASSADSSPLA
jgi:hypothetical protein